MITDDERREVAAKIRGNAHGRPFYGDLVADMAGAGPVDDEARWKRLADLIDPDNIPDNADGNARGLSGHCDRDALLELAGEMAADSVRSAKQGISVSPVYILHAARNIAEACGETFGSIRNRELAEWGTSFVPKETIVDRDALLELADTMEGYARFCRESSIQVGNNIVECYASRIREAVDACESDSDAHADENEAADGARTPSIEVIRWVNEHGGLDEVKRRVWTSNYLNDKLRSRERKIERLKKALSYADAKNAERREGAKLIRKHGGLGEVRRMIQAGMDRRIAYGTRGRKYRVTELCEYEPSIVHAQAIDDGELGDEFIAANTGLNSYQLDASKLTHERPVADTWEQLEKDTNDLIYDIGFHLGDYSPSDFNETGDSVQDRVRDIVRRTKKLAERERGE